MDPFPTEQWATDVLDEVRRAVWNPERGVKGRATRGSESLKKARFASWKNPEDLTGVLVRRSELNIQFVCLSDI
jgi:transposase